MLATATSEGGEKCLAEERHRRPTHPSFVTQCNTFVLFSNSFRYSFTSYYDIAKPRRSRYVASLTAELSHGERTNCRSSSHGGESLCDGESLVAERKHLGAIAAPQERDYHLTQAVLRLRKLACARHQLVCSAQIVARAGSE